MRISTAMQPASSRHKFSSSEGEEGLLHSAAVAEEQALIQKIEAQAALLLKESEILQHLSHQLMERSHGEAHQEAMHARTQADTMRAGALAAKNEIQAARTQSRDGKGRRSSHKLSAMAADMGTATRFGTQEKATVDKAASYYSALTSAEQAAKTSPSLAHTVIRAVKQVTQVSAVAVVGPPVFRGLSHYSAAPFGGMMERMSAAGEQVAEGISQQWDRATAALEEAVEVVMESPVMVQARALGRNAWQKAQHVGHAVAEFVAAPVETSKKVAKLALDKAVAVKDEAARLADEYVAKPVATAADAVAKGAKRAYRAASEGADAAMDYAAAKLDGAKKLVGRLWSGDEKTPVLVAATAGSARTTGALAHARQQSVACRLPVGLLCQPVSPAQPLRPTEIKHTGEFTSIFAFAGTVFNQ